MPDMTHRIAFMLATTIAAGAVPQYAWACIGSGCNLVSVPDKLKYSSFDKTVAATLVDKDQNNKVHLRYCISAGGNDCLSGTNSDVTLDPGTAKKSA